MKQCRRCNSQKPPSQFNADASRPDGLFPYCVDCKQAYQKKRREEFRYVVYATPDEKRCSKCKEVKPASEFPPSTPGNTKDGLYAWCHKCCAENTRVQYAKNPDRFKDYNAKRRARKKEVTVEPVSRYLVWLKAFRKCHICNKVVGFYAMHLDHVVPLCKGGEHSYANCRPAHAPCNLKKGTKDAESVLA